MAHHLRWLIALVLAPPALAADGAALYRQHCLSCHQADGRGAADFSPSILESPLIGDPLGMAALIVTGRDAPDSHWMTVMPAYPQLSDQELAALIDYLGTLGEPDRAR